jgi:hypothetical protein
MKIDKRLLTAIILFFFIIGVLYLCGAFLALSFNPARWDGIGRVLFATIGLFISGSISAAYYRYK